LGGNALPVCPTNRELPTGKQFKSVARKAPRKQKAPPPQPPPTPPSSQHRRSTTSTPYSHLSSLGVDPIDAIMVPPALFFVHPPDADVSTVLDSPNPSSTQCVSNPPEPTSMHGSDETKRTNSSDMTNSLTFPRITFNSEKEEVVDESPTVHLYRRPVTVTPPPSGTPPIRKTKKGKAVVNILDRTIESAIDRVTRRKTKMIRLWLSHVPIDRTARSYVDQLTLKEQKIQRNSLDASEEDIAVVENDHLNSPRVSSESD